MEHRNPKVSEGRHRGQGGRQYEDNICTYRYGEILHASAVLLKLFGLYVNWRGPAFSFQSV